MALELLAEHGSMTVYLDVDALDRASTIVVTHTRALRPRLEFLPDATEPLFRPLLEDGRGTTTAFPRPRQLARTVFRHARFGLVPGLVLPPCVFYERDWER